MRPRIALIPLLAVVLLSARPAFSGTDPGVPDTVKVGQVTVADASSEITIRVPVSVTWDEANIMAVSIPIFWDSPDVSIDTDSSFGGIAGADFSGGFAAGAFYTGLGIGDDGQSALLAAQELFSTFPGDGTERLLCEILFKVRACADSQSVEIYTGFFPPMGELLLCDDFGQGWTPQFVPGRIEILSGCPPDTEPPVAICPGSFSVKAPHAAPGIPVGFVATATDNEPGVVISCDPPSGSFFPLGATPVTCVATDAVGLKDTCAFNLTVTTSDPDPGTPDMVRAAHVSVYNVSNDVTIRVPVSVTWDEADLMAVNLPIFWASPDLSIDTDSSFGGIAGADFSGGFAAGAFYAGLGIGADGQSALLAAQELFSTFPGDGTEKLLCEILFKVRAGADSQCVGIYTGFFPPMGELLLYDDGGKSWTPQFVPGRIAILSDCPDANGPPIATKPQGSSFGRVGSSMSYRVAGSDPDSDDVYYELDWGDGSPNEWHGPFESDHACCASHEWASGGRYLVRARAVDIMGNLGSWSEPLAVRVFTVRRILAEGLTLGVKRDPVNPVFEFGYSISSACVVNMEIFDVSGRKVGTVVGSSLEAGSHSATWDARDLASGVYFCRLRAGDQAVTCKIAVVR